MLESKEKVNLVLNPTEKKLMQEITNHVGKISYKLLEEFIIKTPSVCRPVVGHCFETWYSKYLNVPIFHLLIFTMKNYFILAFIS